MNVEHPTELEPQLRFACLKEILPRLFLLNNQKDMFTSTFDGGANTTACVHGDNVGASASCMLQ
jgi:hypothetical protein